MDSLAYIDEGLPLPLPSPVVPFVPTCFWTTVTQTIDGVVTEDWNQPTPDPHSLCALLGDLHLDDICLKCQGPTILVAASSKDWCLKQLNTSFYREDCVNVDGVGESDCIGYHSSTGSYELNPYDSILRFAPAFFPGALDPAIECSQLRLDFIDQPQDPAATVGLRVGHSAAPADPNVDTSRIVWRQFSQKALKNPSPKTPAQHLAANTVPESFLRWVMLSKARVLYLELTQGGTGGDCTYSGVQAEIKPVTVRDA
jgi:hypothetical protein